MDSEEREGVGKLQHHDCIGKSRRVRDTVERRWIVRERRIGMMYSEELRDRDIVHRWIVRKGRAWESTTHHTQLHSEEQEVSRYCVEEKDSEEKEGRDNI